MTEAIPTSPAWRPPPQFDEYRLIRSLGAGAMGQVFLAHDQVLDRQVAIKFVIDTEVDEEAKERLIVEARAIARLQHPNVVAVFRVSAVDGQPYLVSEFVHGQRLDEIDKPVPWKRVQAIALGLASGLAAAHRRGVLHRDIKLANAIVSEEDGEAKLLDFGLAKLIDRGLPSPLAEAAGSSVSPAAKVVHLSSSITGSRTSSSLSVTVDRLSRTEVGAIVGSPLYVAPELWAGETASPRSDIYALGVALFYLAAGSPPHMAQTVEALASRVTDYEAPRLREVAPSVDPGLAAVIDRCLRRDPGLRFQTADELREALDQLTPDSPSGAVPEGNPYRGLAAFHAEHRAIFFGRGAETRRILDRLRAESVVLVAGDSGVGKSSICHAGVLPRVAKGALGGGRAWSAVTLVPGRWPAYALANALAPFLEADPSLLLERLKQEPALIGKELRARQANHAGLLILVDQLEELSTISDPFEAGVFANAIASLAKLAPGARVLAAVRADFIARIAGLPGLGEDLGRSLFVLQPLSLEGMREAIVGPARTKGVMFEPEALLVLEASAKAEGSLPLLQFALAELWDRRDLGKQTIPLSALEASGGVAGALARHADEVIASLAPNARVQARGILTRLVTAKGTRARRSESELLSSHPGAKAAIDALVEGRLISATEGSDGTAYDLAHEALISGWASFRQWLDEDAEARAARERVAGAAAEWERLGRSKEALFGERQLADLARLEASGLPLRELAFLDASKRSVRRAKRSRLARLLVVPMTALFAFGVVQLKAHIDLAASVDKKLAEAEPPIAQARAERQQLERVRREAFEAFDQADVAAGERAWAKALALESALGDVYGVATRALETAMLLDPSRDDVRRRVADLLFERTALAALDRRWSERDELLTRLEIYDRDGSRKNALTAPGRLSMTSTPPGATAKIARYRKTERRKRDLEPFRDLGTTPIVDAPIEPGSYLVVLMAPGRAQVRYPLRIDREEHVEAAADLPAAGDIPAGFIYVPQGRFEFGNSADEALRRGFLSTVPRHVIQSEAYLISGTETTYGEWLEFLSALPPSERDKRAPRILNAGVSGSVSLEQITTKDGASSWQLTIEPTVQAYRARAHEMIHYPGRQVRANQDWLKLPVSGIAFDDAKAYADWLHASGRVPGARVCTEHEWERAARGADDRDYPHGDALEPEDANYAETYGKELLAFGPDEVGSHPASASPFGVEDLAGNVLEWTASVLSPGKAVIRGGSYQHNKTILLSTYRQTSEPSLRVLTLGMRVCATFRGKR